MQNLEKQIFDLIDKDKWDEAIDKSWRMPVNWDVHQRMPSAKEMPDYAINKVLDKLSDPRNPHSQNFSSFLYELASNLPKNASPETLNRINKLSTDDYTVREALMQHPNFQLDGYSRALKNASDYWREYERGVGPDHFATIKSMYSGKPEVLKDHRGNSGESGAHLHILPDLKEYASAVQDKVLNDEDIVKKFIKGEPHIKVYRGVNGNYGKKIRDAVSYNPDTNQVIHKKINIPTASFSSWTTDPQIARQFVWTRDNIDGQPGNNGVVMAKWMPVKDILHSGYHKTQAIHEHAHPAESEIVFGHPSGKMSVMSSEMEFQHPHSTDYGSTVLPEVIKDVKKTEEVEIDLDYLIKSIEYKKPLIAALTAFTMMGIPKDSIKEMPKPIEQLNIAQIPVSEKVEPHPELEPIRMIECKKPPCNHKPVNNSLHQGTHALGNYGLMPIQISDTVNRSPFLKSKYPELVSMNPVIDFETMKAYFRDHPELEIEVANTHWDYLKNKFNGDKDRMAYAWLNGATAAKEALEEHVKNHWYPKKYRRYERLNKLTPAIKKSEPVLKEHVYDYIKEFDPFNNNHFEAQNINKAIKSKEIADLSNTGKFTQNSFVVGYTQDNSWLLKLEPVILPKSESIKHSGLQSFKEAAFYDISKQVFKFYDIIPKAVLGYTKFDPEVSRLGITNPNWPTVAIQMLPDNYRLADDLNKENPGIIKDILEHYRKNGDVHRIAAMMWILGETDAHGNNLMTDGVNIKLIDHGSAFADLSFDPANDDSIFLPYILRTGRFKETDNHKIKEENIAKIDNKSVQQEVKHWILSLDSTLLMNLMKKYDLDPKAVLIRLKYLQSLVKMSEEPDLVINELWLRGMR